MEFPLTERQQQLLGVFRRAIGAEQQAQEMYTGAATLCDDPELKALLQSFAKEEAHHEQKLLEFYQNLRVHGSFKNAA